MMSPAGMAIAAITVMLWILWSDTLRGRASKPLYAVRVGLYLVMTGVMIYNLVRYPHLYRGTARVLGIVAAVIGAGGAVYFARKIAK